MAEYLDVLVLCSDPVNFTHTLNLAQELVHFEWVIRDSQLPVRLSRVFPPTLDQLRKQFARATALDRQPSVFHFLGHGDDDGLYFENEHGQLQLVKGHELREVLGQSPVKLALLNACWSATKRGVSLCDFLTREQVAGAAIGHQRPVADDSAIVFARQFYALLVEGRTIRQACQRAANSLAEQGKFGASEVKLVGAGDVVLTAGLPNGSRPCVIESGLPKLGHLPDTGAFFGRGDELVQLSQSLADARLSGFGLWGIGGIGKTALAKVAARRNAWRYQGAVWVDIRDATQKTTAELLRLALARLHPGAPDSDPAFELSRRMQAAPSLVVLDNLEDLPESEHAALARFVQQLPKNGPRVLMTARVPLPAIERLADVQSRRMTEGLDDWNGAHYVQHVARQKQCLALQDELRIEAGQPVGLCALVSRRLHGHPKMLELAVGVGLKGRPALEQALVSLPDDLEEQLAAMLATSLGYLGEDGRRVLPLLGFFPTGGLTPEALDVGGMALERASLPPASDDDSEGADPDLAWLAHGREQLVAAGLLEYDQSRDVYTFHQSILDEAQRHPPSDKVRSTVTTALFMHYVAYLIANHSDDARIDRCFEPAIDLMESCWSHRDGESGFDTVLTDMTDCLGDYFRQRGLWRLGQQWHERAIELRRTSKYAKDELALAWEVLQLGRSLAALGKPDAARHALSEARGLFEQASDERGMGAALLELGRVESALGNRNEARALLERSKAIKESLADLKGIAATLHELASIESSQGNPSKARDLLGRSSEIFESLQDQRGIAASLHQLASIELAQRNPSDARRHLQRCLAILESLEDWYGLAATLHTLATLKLVQGDLTEARRLLDRSKAIKESLGDQHGLAASLHGSAQLEIHQGNPSDARRLLQRSLEIRRSLEDQRGVAESSHLLARLELEQGDLKESWHLLESALAIIEPSEDCLGRAVCLHGLAQVELAEENWSEARCLFERCIGILEPLGNKQGLAASLHGLATVEATNGDRPRARELWERSIEIKDSMGDVAGAAVSRGMLAQLEAQDRQFACAVELAKQAVRDLENARYAQAEPARSILTSIEQLAACNQPAAPPDSRSPPPAD